MSAITVTSTFGRVEVAGLFSRDDVAGLLLALCAAPDAYEALDAALAAKRDLDDEGTAARFAQARYDRAFNALTEHCVPPTVELDPEEARRLRELLISARLGQGRAAVSAYGRRTA